MTYGQQLRSRHVVVVPKIMMNRLEMPQAFSRAGIQRQQAVAEQVIALPVAAVEVVGRRSGRDVNNAALLIKAHVAPIIGGSDVLPGILRPSLVTELARVRNSVELPY